MNTTPKPIIIHRDLSYTKTNVKEYNSFSKCTFISEKFYVKNQVRSINRERNTITIDYVYVILYSTIYQNVYTRICKYPSVH